MHWPIVTFQCHLFRQIIIKVGELVIYTTPPQNPLADTPAFPELIWESRISESWKFETISWKCDKYEIFAPFLSWRTDHFVHGLYIKKATHVCQLQLWCTTRDVREWRSSMLRMCVVPHRVCSNLLGVLVKPTFSLFFVLFKQSHAHTTHPKNMSKHITIQQTFKLKTSTISE